MGWCLKVVGCGFVAGWCGADAGRYAAGGCRAASGMLGWALDGAARLVDSQKGSSAVGFGVDLEEIGAAAGPEAGAKLVRWAGPSLLGEVGPDREGEKSVGKRAASMVVDGGAMPPDLVFGGGAVSEMAGPRAPRCSPRLAGRIKANTLDSAVTRKALLLEDAVREGGATTRTRRKKIRGLGRKCGVALSAGEAESLLKFISL